MQAPSALDAIDWDRLARLGLTRDSLCLPEHAFVLTEASLRAPWLSVAAAWMTCSPTLSLLVFSAGPVPICPSWLDDHTMRSAGTSPSSASETAETRTTLAPARYSSPACGRTIATWGGSNRAL